MNRVELFEKRRKVLNQLYLLYPQIRFQAQNKARWTPYFNFNELDEHRYAPAIHYTLLPNEVVIELYRVDGDHTSLHKTNRDYGNFTKAAELLKSAGIPLTFGFSGNKSWHIHFLVKPPKDRLEDFMEHPDCQRFTFALFRYLVRYLRGEGVIGIGESIMRHRRVRSFYSQHVETGCFKIPNKLDEETVYPCWEVSKAFYRVAMLEMEKFGRRIEVTDTDDDSLPEVLKKLEQYKRRETSTYIYYTCLFHQPDRNPSFTFHKKKKIFTDWHDGKRYSAKELLSKLLSS